MAHMLPWAVSSVVVFTLMAGLATAVQTIELGGAGWEMYNGPKNISLPVSTPVYALEAIYAAGMVKEDPLYRHER